MKNRVRDFLTQLRPDVENVISKVMQAESEKLSLRRPHGIIDEIKKIVQKEVKEEREN